MCIRDRFPHGDFSPPKGRKKAFIVSTHFFITFQNRFLMISDPWFTLKSGPKSRKNAPKAEKVDFSKSGVLPAWEHDFEGFRPPKIIKNHKKIGLKDTLKKTTIFRPHFQWFWSILGIPFGVWERSFWVKGGGSVFVICWSLFDGPGLLLARFCMFFKFYFVKLRFSKKTSILPA